MCEAGGRMECRQNEESPDSIYHTMHDARDMWSITENPQN